MDLNSLLQKARSLSNTIDQSHELPAIDLTLPQVLHAAEELHSRVTRTGSKDLQAHLLLGAKGVDLTQITNKLNSLNAHQVVQISTDPKNELDVKGFLKNARENAVLSIIDETNRDLFKMQKKQKWANVCTEWRQEKLRILNSFVGTTEEMLDINQQPQEKTVVETGSLYSSLSRTEWLFATAILEYNKLATTTTNGASINLVEKFVGVVETLDDVQVSEMWSIIQYMTSVPHIPFAADPIAYRHDTPHFIRQAKIYLEDRYKRYMQSIITTSRRPAERGGKPTLQSLVKAFVTVTYVPNTRARPNDSEMYEGCPFWQLVYYCLRCGDLKGAFDFLKRSGKALNDLECVFEEKLREPGRKINPMLAAHLKVYYTDKVRSASDPFQKAVYCIVLGCDKYACHDVVAPTTDDFLWIQLSLVDNANGDRSEQLSYADLQSIVLEKYGESYFNARDQVHLYFSVLALTGQFEAAIEFLVRRKSHYVHAVHMALALNELGLLGGPEDVRQPLLSVNNKDPKPMRRLNLPRLLLLYVKNFETTNINEALHYYHFLRKLKDCEGRNLFLVCVYDLIIETGAYDLILGQPDPHNGGKVVGGLFEQFSTSEYTTVTVMQVVADDLVLRGSLELSIRLYDMAGDHTKAVRQLIILLSQVAHLPHSANSTRARLAELASDFYSRLIAHKIELNPDTAMTLRIFKHILDFFDCYHVRNFSQAADHLAQAKIIPLSMDDLDECVLKFKRLSADISKIFPDVMLAAMEIVYAEYKSLQKSDQHAMHLEFFRQKAKAITSMAAMVPYRMPGDTNKRIVQMEILMH